MRQGIRVLVLEDDQELLGAMVGSLELEGYDVRGAEGSARALELGAEFSFDIVVTDVRMDGLDGLAALGRLKTHQPHLQSLVVSGYSAEEDSLRAVALGVQGFLKKPFSLDRFLAEVDRLAAKVLQARQGLAQQEWVARLSLWVLRHLAASAGPGGELLEVGRLAARLARQEKLDEPTCRLAEMAVLTRLLLDAGVDVELVLEGLPERVSLWLDGKDNESLLAQVAAGAMGGKSRPELWGPEPSEPASSDSQERQRLLALALTLEGTGEREAAFEAFEEVTNLAGPWPEVVEALQGLARLRPDLAPHALSRAFELAHQLGPVKEAHTLLESGIQLAQTGSDVFAARVLARAVERFGELALPAELARARLAMLSLDPKPVDWLEASIALLTRPDQLLVLLESASWLARLLLTLRPQSGEGVRALRRLVQDAPQQLARLVRGGQLDSSARLYLAHQLSPSAQTLLELLSSDPDPAVQEAARRVKSSQSATTPPVVRVRSFGFFEVVRGDETLSEDSWRTRKIWQFLALLVLHRDRFVSEEVVREILWPETSQAKRSVYQACSEIRRFLRPPDWPVKLNYIERSRDGMRLNPELPIWHDLEALKEQLKTARRLLGEGSLEAGLEACFNATNLYRAPYLQNCYQDWAVRERDRVWLELAVALREFAEAAGAAHKPQARLELANFILLHDPSDQLACVEAMEAELALGQPHLAIERFETATAQLAREYGLEPSVEMHRSYLKAKYA